MYCFLSKGDGKGISRCPLISHSAPFLPQESKFVHGMQDGVDVGVFKIGLCDVRHLCF